MNSILLWGFLGSLAAGLATSLGAIPALVFGRLNERTETLMLGFAAGVMLAASVFSLILPGLDAASVIVGNERGGVVGLANVTLGVDADVSNNGYAGVWLAAAGAKLSVGAAARVMRVILIS